MENQLDLNSTSTAATFFLNISISKRVNKGCCCFHAKTQTQLFLESRQFSAKMQEKDKLPLPAGRQGLRLCVYFAHLRETLLRALPPASRLFVKLSPKFMKSVGWTIFKLQPFILWR